MHKKGAVWWKRGGRDGHSTAGITLPWKRGHDPYCTQTASKSGKDMERVSAYLPQSSTGNTGGCQDGPYR